MIIIEYYSDFDHEEIDEYQLMSIDNIYVDGIIQDVEYLVDKLNEFNIHYKVEV
tara:strand:- start:735 stop:896 length:162 start_codon:yes stop_codon:yes gene_type:complete